MKYLIIFLIFFRFIFANEADCVILKDENSIICKYKQDRVDYEKEVRFDWIEPTGVISRSRIMIIPAGHGSVYDYRYIEGRTKGKWIFRVTDGNQTYETSFVLK